MPETFHGHSFLLTSPPGADISHLLSPAIPGSKVSTPMITRFTWLPSGHNFLPSHSFLLSLNSSPFRSLTSTLCFFTALLFLISVHFFSHFSYLGYCSPDIKLLFNSCSPSVISLLLNFISETGL